MPCRAANWTSACSACAQVSWFPIDPYTPSVARDASELLHAKVKRVSVFRDQIPGDDAHVGPEFVHLIDDTREFAHVQHGAQVNVAQLNDSEPVEIRYEPRNPEFHLNRPDLPSLDERGVAD
jgi:hypothetical protein